MHLTTMIAASNGRQVHRVLKSALNFEKYTEFHEVHQASKSAPGFKGASSLKKRIELQERIKFQESHRASQGASGLKNRIGPQEAH